MIAKVKKWLAEEKLHLTTSPQLYFDFYTRVNDDVRKFEYGIGVETDRNDSVLISAIINLTDPDKKVFKNFSKAKRVAFRHAIVESVFFIDIFFTCRPSFDTPEAFILEERIYFDGLTKDRFFKSVNTIWRAFVLLEETYKEHIWYRSGDVPL